MTNSNVHAARMRKQLKRDRSNARFAHEMQNFAERELAKRKAREDTKIRNKIKNAAIDVRDFVGGMFRRFASFDSKRVATLDLTSSRGAGALWLRQTFGHQLKMISTRDGKPV